MALVQRVAHDPNAIDIAAIQRQKSLEIWRRQRESAEGENRQPWWKQWLGRS
jgi:hypothetical protein